MEDLDNAEFKTEIQFLEEKLKIIQQKYSGIFLFSLHNHLNVGWARAAVVLLNLRAGSTFPVPVFTVSPGLWVNRADTQ